MANVRVKKKKGAALARNSKVMKLGREVRGEKNAEILLREKKGAGAGTQLSQSAEVGCKARP